MKKHNYVYLLVENNEYEFPVHIADTMAEMSILTGYSVTKLLNALHRESDIDGYKIYKVDISEPTEDKEIQEEFGFILSADFDEYKEFCKKNKLNYKDFKSFGKYKESMKK